MTCILAMAQIMEIRGDEADCLIVPSLSNGHYMVPMSWFPAGAELGKGYAVDLQPETSDWHRLTLRRHKC